jgi:hypothetical protein
MKKLIAALAATAMLAAVPAAAVAQTSAAPLSLSRIDGARAGAPVTDESALDGGSTVYIIAGLIALGVIIYFVVDGDDDGPSSP